MNNEKQIIFFHIPKCMGTSINDLFKQEYGHDKVLSPATVYDYMHTPYDYFLKFKVLSGHITKDCLAIISNNIFLMTILRNPGRRLLSLYSYYQLLPESEIINVPSAQAAQVLDFHDWLDSGIPGVIVETSNAIARYFVPDRFYVDVKPANPQNIVKAATNFLETFDFIGFQEHSELVSIFINSILTSNHFDIPRLNVSHSEKVKFDPIRLRDFLFKECSLDIEFIKHARTLMTTHATYSHEKMSAGDRALFEFID